MGRPKGQYIINELPESTRSKVLDALLAGASLRECAKIGGVSHEAVKTYKQNVFLPAVHKARQIQALQGLPTSDTQKAIEHISLTRDVIQTSPLRDRLQFLWSESEDAVKRAKRAVRVVKDPASGELVPVGPDVAAIAPVLNQAHKNCELLGRVTGELESAPSANIAVQIVMPGAPQNPPAAELPYIDVSVKKR